MTDTQLEALTDVANRCAADLGGSLPPTVAVKIAELAAVYADEAQADYDRILTHLDRAIAACTQGRPEQEIKDHLIACLTAQGELNARLYGQGPEQTDEPADKSRALDCPRDLLAEFIREMRAEVAHKSVGRPADAATAVARRLVAALRPAGPIWTEDETFTEEVGQENDEWHHAATAAEKAMEAKFAGKIAAQKRYVRTGFEALHRICDLRGDDAAAVGVPAPDAFDDDPDTGLECLCETTKRLLETE